MLATAVDGDVDAMIAENADQAFDVGQVRHVSSVSVSDVRSEAIIRGSAAFLAPEIG